jgi:hypothetical protein
MLGDLFGRNLAGIFIYITDMMFFQFFHAILADLTDIRGAAEYGNILYDRLKDSAGGQKVQDNYRAYRH